MDEDIKKAIRVLKAGGTILYPTDTIWGIGCDATNKSAVSKVYKIKNRSKNASYIVLLCDASQLKEYVKVLPPIIWDLIESIDTPTTIIYSGAKNLAKNVIHKDGSIGIRVVKDDFCSRLIKEFGKPIVSTSANLSGDPAPYIFRDISDLIKKRVDYIVESNRNMIKKTKASTIIKLKDSGEFDILRQ
jgi:L-threonylcarbamoyladenylate synthase